MTPAGMVAMRIAATLAHALPTVRVRLRHADVTLLEVAHPAEAEGHAIGACAFRRAVACAHEQTKRGQQVGFMGLGQGDDPAVDIGVRSGDAALPGGIYRVTVGDQTIHGFVTVLPPRRCRDVLDVLGHDDGIRLHHDAATEATFVHTVAATDTAPEDAAHLQPVLEAFLADEVLHELAGLSG